MPANSLFPTNTSFMKANSINNKSNNSTAVNNGADNMRVTRKRSAHMNKETSLFPQ